MKKTYINTLKAGDTVDDIFLLSEKTLSQKKDGNNFLNIRLSDKTGSLKGVVWDNVDQLAADLAVGAVVRVKAGVSEYKGSLQLVVRDLVPSADPADPRDFMPCTNRNTDTMFDRLVSITDTMETDHFRRLFQAFWKDHDFVRRFKIAPAAKKMHHAYLGGLLEHTLSMVLLVDKIAGHYGGINRDLLLAGAILHDIGKIREFDYRFGIDYSDEGRLLSHIVIGLEMVDEKLRKTGSFPEKEAFLLKHLIVSHHGSREFGSPEPPKTIEAVLLNYVDEIDSKVNAIRDHIASEEPGASWTSYHRLLARHFYTGNN